MAAAVGSMAGGRFAWADTPRPTSSLPLDQLKLTGTPDEAYWWKVRSQFNIIDGMAFMNNGTQGPMPRYVYEENDRVLREIAEDPSNNYRRDGLNEVRKKLAQFFGADAAEISYTRSTTEGMNIFAMGIDWKEGDEVVMNSHEHPGGYKAYMALERRRGITVKRIEVPSPPESIDQIVDIYEKAITPKTRAFVVSHITYVTGLLTPIKELSELAHRKGLLITVDGAHPPGMLDLDFHDMGCDHYAAAGQKWMLCGTGTGTNYIKRDVQDQVWPLMGVGGNVRDGEWTPTEDASRYEECGQRDIPSALGMGASVTFHETIGKQNIEARVRQLSLRLKEGLKEIPGVKLWTSMDPKLSAGLTLFSVRDIPMANVRDGIMDLDRVYIRTMRTGGLNGCRASTHLYNMPSEVDRLLKCVRHIAEHSSDYMQATA
jgi:selenocysteine lyase/cysteine desulfurase